MKTDFSIQLTPGKPFTILQLTDTQVINGNAELQDIAIPDANGNLPDAPDDLVKKCFIPINKVIEEAKPELILITGDNVYGCFDHNGLYLKLFINFIDSFGIPWSHVYGNHDEPDFKLGLDALCKHYEDAKNCLYNRGSVWGDSNYTIGLYEDDELVRVIYMMDSEGYYHSKEEPTRFFRAGFARNQIYWLLDLAREFKGDRELPVPGFFCCHNPTADYDTAMIELGYLKNLDRENQIPIFIGTKEQAMSISPELNYVEGSYPNDADRKTTVLCVPPVNEGDFGFRRDETLFKWNSQSLEPVFLLTGIDGVFAGHNHKNNHIINYHGVRYVQGAKSSLYDMCGLPNSQAGGTKITLEADRKKFNVEHIFLK